MKSNMNRQSECIFQWSLNYDSHICISFLTMYFMNHPKSIPPWEKRRNCVELIKIKTSVPDAWTERRRCTHSGLLKALSLHRLMRLKKNTHAPPAEAKHYSMTEVCPTPDTFYAKKASHMTLFCYIFSNEHTCLYFLWLALKCTKST